VTYLAAYAALAALGEALVAKPALIWIRSQGIFEPALAQEVRGGAASSACAVLVALLTFAVAARAKAARTPPASLHLAFLFAVATCVAVRAASDEPRPGPGSAPALLEAIRSSAEELDRSWNGSYAPDGARFAFALAPVAPPFRRLGHRIALRPRILYGAGGPQLRALPGDLPGTVYVAISPDRQAGWITALDLEGVLALRAHGPAIAQAYAGTHSPPGRDGALPLYRPK